jgi:prepilin-type N-terminal cleavage/methylation domain-containing protein
MYPFRPGAPPRHRTGAFTLVEIMVVVVIIGLLAMLALPAFGKFRRNTQNARFISDLRTFVQEFESYSLQNGSWPATAGNGVVPTGMSGGLRQETWASTSTLGGAWSWEYDTTANTANIAVSNFTAADSQLIQIDAKIDDGDLTAGLLQKSGTKIVYFLQK